jgi:hypothetical protein
LNHNPVTGSLLPVACCRGGFQTRPYGSPLFSTAPVLYLPCTHFALFVCALALCSMLHALRFVRTAIASAACSASRRGSSSSFPPR